jgi:hypothetical protein
LFSSSCFWIGGDEEGCDGVGVQGINSCCVDDSVLLLLSLILCPMTKGKEDETLAPLFCCSACAAVVLSEEKGSIVPIIFTL